MNNQSPEELKEIMRRWLNGEPRQWADSDNPIVWRDCAPEDIAWNTKLDIYRIKPSKKRVPLTPGDLPAVCWLKADYRGSIQNAVVAVGDGFVRIMLAGSSTDIFFNDLMESNWQYSSDRVNWYPCWKEVEQ